VTAHLDRIRQARDRFDRAEQDLTDAVRRAKEAGATWAELAEAIGLETRTGAQTWFARRSRDAA